MRFFKRSSPQDDPPEAELKELKDLLDRKPLSQPAVVLPDIPEFLVRDTDKTVPTRAPRLMDMEDYKGDFKYRLEEISRILGVNYDFLKQRYLCGEGRCWVCGEQNREDRDLFCTKHGLELVEQDWRDDEKYKGYKLGENLILWSMEHDDFVVPYEFACPKCSIRFRAIGDYLCRECRG